jgi:hypothetical protein
LSVRQLARRWGVSPKRIRDLIRRRLLGAFDIGSRRRQLRISPEAIKECERRLAVGTPAPARRQKKKKTQGIDPEIVMLLDVGEVAAS